jgi:hypothetical protein
MTSVECSTDEGLRTEERLQNIVTFSIASGIEDTCNVIATF